MNWLEKVSQYNIESILIAVVNGRLSAESAFKKLSASSNSFDCCDQITSLFQNHPEATRPLSALSRMFQCNSVMTQGQGQGQTPQQPVPIQEDVEKPLEIETPSIEIQ